MTLAPSWASKIISVSLTGSPQSTYPEGGRSWRKWTTSRGGMERSKTSTPPLPRLTRVIRSAGDAGVEDRIPGRYRRLGRDVQTATERSCRDVAANAGAHPAVVHHRFRAGAGHRADGRPQTSLPRRLVYGPAARKCRRRPV